MRRVSIVTLALALAGCTLVTDSSQFLNDGSVPDAGDVDAAGFDAGPGIDGGDFDGGDFDGGDFDAGDVDAGDVDAGPPPEDAGPAGPEVVILSSTVPDGGTTNTSRVEITFTANPSTGGDVFECQLESVTASGTDSTGFVPCTSPQTYELLEAGLHTFSVHARGASTPFGPDATRQWTLEAMGVDIRTIQEGVATSTFNEETLVSVNARVQRDFAAGGGFPRAVAIADAGGSLAASAWHGIFTEPRDSGESSLASGIEVTVVGTVREIDRTTWLVGSTYTRGAMVGAHTYPSSRDSGELVTEAMEGLVVQLGGSVPSSFNCTFCSGSPSGPRCIETCEGACRPIRHRNLSGHVDYGDYGYYTGGLIDGGREIWVFDFSDNSDACL